MLRSILTTLLVLLPAAAAAAANGLAVSGQWMRALAGGMPAAGYFVLRNDAAMPARLIGASSPACGSLTLHQTIRQHTMSAMSALDPQNPTAGMPGMSMMQPVAGVPIASHGTIGFTPGGYHLMCEQPTDAVRPGASVEVTLRFEGGGTLDAAFPVRSARGR